MIKSDIIKINFTTDNYQIEQALSELGIEPLRWAVIAVDDISLTVSVSYVN